MEQGDNEDSNTKSIFSPALVEEKIFGNTLGRGLNHFDKVVFFLKLRSISNPERSSNSLLRYFRLIHLTQRLEQYFHPSYSFYN